MVGGPPSRDFVGGKGAKGDWRRGLADAIFMLRGSGGSGGRNVGRPIKSIQLTNVVH